MSFKVGQKVVCVNDDFTEHKKNDPNFHVGLQNLPKEGVTYTVRTSEGPAIRLDELVNPVIPINLGDRQSPLWIEDEPAFHMSRFAPLLDNRDQLTDSLLNDLTKDINKDVKEYEPLLVPEDEDILFY